MTLPPEGQLPEDSVGFVLSDVLETINTVFAQAAVELPGRQYIAIGGSGDTVHDCEQLTVSFEQLYSGTPGAQAQEPTRCEGPRTTVVIVELVRCVPAPVQTRRTGNLSGPDINDMNAYALRRAKDAWLLMTGLLAAADSWQYTPGMSDVTAGPSQGGYQPLIATLVVAVP